MPIPTAFTDLRAELASTRRMLERYPDGRGNYKPHPKSRSLAQLATHVADIPNRGTSILTTDGIEMASGGPRPVHDTAAELLAAFDAGAAQVTAALEQAGDAGLVGEWHIRAGGAPVFGGPKPVMLRAVMLSHMIHHRAQLGDYYRMLDVPVPGMYGPSADDTSPR